MHDPERAWLDFLKFENEKKMLSQQIRGVPWWDLLRMSVSDILITGDFNQPSPHSGFAAIKPLQKILSTLKLLKNSVFRAPTQAKPGTDLLVFNHARKVLKNGQYVCPYTEALLEVLEIPFTVIENPHMGKHFSPTPTRNLWYKDRYDLLYELRRALRILTFQFWWMKKTERAIIHRSLSTLATRLGVDLPIARLIKEIDMRMPRYAFYYKAWKKVLVKLKPKAVLEVVSYSDNRAALNVAARELGIPTIELQHGAMGPLLPPYNFLVKTTPKLFPDHICLFGDFWRDTTRLPLPPERIHVTGHPFFEEKVRTAKMRNPAGKTTVCRILFISQGTIGRELSLIAVELQNLLPKDRFAITCKLHPGEFTGWRARYPELAKSGITVHDDSLTDLYDLFATSRVLVGAYSTALFEGLAFVDQLYICALPGHVYVADLYRNGYATLVHSADELAGKLQSPASGKNVPNVDYFWRPGGIALQKAVIEKICRSRAVSKMQ